MRHAKHRATSPGLKARAIGLLARRDYGREELRAKLLRDQDRDTSRQEEIDRILDELAALGYLSDERYALGLTARKARTHSRLAIASELKARRVEGNAAANALSVVALDDDATMLALWQRRFGRPPADDREKGRQVRFLQSRGFGLSAILKLLKTSALEGEDAPPPDFGHDH